MKLLSSIIAGISVLISQKRDMDRMPVRKGQMFRGRGAMFNQRQKRVRRRRRGYK